MVSWSPKGKDCAVHCGLMATLGPLAHQVTGPRDEGDSHPFSLFNPPRKRTSETAGQGCENVRNVSAADTQTLTPTRLGHS